MLSKWYNFLGPALTQGSCLEPLGAHRLCPLTDSLPISSAGAGGNALPHLLPTLLSLFRSVHPLTLPFSVWVEFEFLQLT